MGTIIENNGIFKTRERILTFDDYKIKIVIQNGGFYIKKYYNLKFNNDATWFGGLNKKSLVKLINYRMNLIKKQK